jgi:hypothetical protein
LVMVWFTCIFLVVDMFDMSICNDY